MSLHVGKIFIIDDKILNNSYSIKLNFILLSHIKEETMELFSQNFQHQEKIPSTYTCDGKNISPALSWSDVPKETSSFALSVIDPDAPGGNFIHWLVYDIPQNISHIPEGGPLPENSKELTNDFGRRTYGGPCPPSGTHRYFFTP